MSQLDNSRKALGIAGTVSQIEYVSRTVVTRKEVADETRQLFLVSPSGRKRQCVAVILSSENSRHRSYASPDESLLGTSHFLISTTLPIASAEPIATEKCIKDSDRASTLSSFA